MYDFFKVLLTIIIEVFIFCIVPTTLRVLRKKPFKKKKASYISIVNFAIIFALFKLVTAKLLNIDFNSITPDLLSLILVPINIYILCHNKNDKKKLKISGKGKLISIGIILSLMIISIIVLIISNGNNDSNITYIKSPKTFNKVISENRNNLIFFGYEGCKFCELALPTIEEIAETYNLKNIYYVDVSKITLSEDNMLEEFPTLAIYNSNKIVSQKSGYVLEEENPELFYRLEITSFLNHYNIII